ncbi:hypothetical protein SODALDRAFT_357373 [Sodiomyces alkalinus F11]|uniref:Uncharacterized protein n=1 Tax=Sodiomyces alkalinus (strain CBS 110278 / VKM F-3762 / F11) TaxID=1314773 RepID=A0A3N2Q3K1_SODAK|nr:hypothetical protein SODALDRAFT_357373 [Sodiomyces alkalinus F11]ROT41339.1 hypothetical protein SODALDRAFT_357373 [Sodiomyces alkalinus F11]
MRRFQVETKSPSLPRVDRVRQEPGSSMAPHSSRHGDTHSTYGPHKHKHKHLTTPTPLTLYSLLLTALGSPFATNSNPILPISHIYPRDPSLCTTLIHVSKLGLIYRALAIWTHGTATAHDTSPSSSSHPSYQNNSPCFPPSLPLHLPLPLSLFSFPLSVPPLTWSTPWLLLTLALVTTGVPTTYQKNQRPGYRQNAPTPRHVRRPSVIRHPPKYFRTHLPPDRQ